MQNKAGIKIVATERFARTDTSVTPQALKINAANPDAVLVVASGSGAAMAGFLICQIISIFISLNCRSKPIHVVHHVQTYIVWHGLYGSGRRFLHWPT
mgnify:CR=1 FL=1